ncbi:MAG: restriction endonuclease subunit S [Hahellaceae bacterium]|nr:restriction endonuclease subunit S [Hahellaceae bacterium]MCP5168480.1 restriction endonuclease subunit S [Hahellaceae bacterium]
MEQVQYTLKDNWAWKTLDDVSEKITDGTHHSPKVQHSEWEPGRFKYITSKNIKNNGMKLDDISYIDQDIHDEIYARCPPEIEDQLLTKDGAMTGTCCLNELNEPFSLLSSVALIKQKRSIILPKYLNYYLQSHVGQNFLLGDISGAAITRTNIKKLKSTPVPLAPYLEQQRIVEKLDALLTRIDTAIEHLQESVTLADALSKNGLSEIFESVKDRYEVVPLSSVVKINSGIALPKLFKNGFSDGDIPFFKVAQMNNHYENMVEPEITFNEKVAKENKIKLFPKGSTLIPKRGGAILTNKKRMLLEDASYDSNIMGLKANESKISDEYLFAFMRTIDLANFVDASTIPQVNNKHIDQMQIPLASVEEQTDVVSRVNLLVKKVETMNSEIQRQLDDLQALKSSILDSAFKGKL